MRLLYIGDAEPETTFIDELRKYHIDLVSMQAMVGHFVGQKHFYRHFHYIKLAMTGHREKKRYDAIFIWQQYIGIYYYLLSLFWPRNHRPVILFYIIYKKPKNKILHKIKAYLFQKSLNSKIFNKVIFINKKDYLFDKINAARKTAVNFYISPSNFIEANHKNLPVKKNYYFSGGTSNRKYNQLKELAKLNPSANIVIAGTPRDRAALKEIPPNLQFITGAYDNGFEKLIMESKAVIIPLDDPNVASGQLVMLRALQAAKIIVITKNTFVLHWLGGRGDGIFIYQYESIQQLNEIIHSLGDEALLKKGAYARTIYKKYFKPENMYRELTGIISQVIETM